MEIVLKSQPSERSKIAEALWQFGREHYLPKAVIQAADLALEEHLTNLMSYAFAGQSAHEIKVRFTVGPDLIVEVEDDGAAFDPLQRPEPDTSLPAEQRPVGGLGIHLMRRFMDELEYQSQGGKNLLRMRKHLPR